MLPMMMLMMIKKKKEKKRILKTDDGMRLRAKMTKKR
jgi:hypothetical protein